MKSVAQQRRAPPLAAAVATPRATPPAAFHPAQFAARWRRWVAAPWHDFPLREHILIQFSSLPALLATPRSRRPCRIFEAGPGAGYAAHCLAGRAELTLAEISPRSAALLARRFAGTPGVRVWRTDLGSEAGLPPAPGAPLEGSFDFAFALDMFEYVDDPAACLRRLAAMLRPGAELFLTFPNTPPPRGDARCWFTHASELEAMLDEAGFARHEILAIHLRSWARLSYALGHEIPLWALRRMRGAGGAARTYEETWAFRHRRRFERGKYPLHLWWSVLAQLLALGGPLFGGAPAAEELLGRRLAIRAWKAS